VGFQLFSQEAGQGGSEPTWKLHTSGTFQGEARAEVFERAQVPNARQDEMLASVTAGGSQVDVGVLRRFDLVPETLLAYPEMVQLLLPTMQADFRLLRGYGYQPAAPFDCPISAFGGTRDTLVRREHLEAWGQHTRGGFKLRMFEGEHLFVKNDPGAVQAALAEDLSARFQTG
jgi:surfactin synthase thioesterase subunit